jgi:hypothetical protein
MDPTLGFVLNEEKHIISRRTIPSLVSTDLDFLDDFHPLLEMQKLLDNLLREAKLVGLSLNFKYLGILFKSSSDNFKNHIKMSWAACIKM